MQNRSLSDLLESYPDIATIKTRCINFSPIAFCWKIILLSKRRFEKVNKLKKKEISVSQTTLIAFNLKWIHIVLCMNVSGIK